MIPRCSIKLRRSIVRHPLIAGRVYAAGYVELELSWRSDFGQYSGFLHAGMIGALIDTSCGFAAVTTMDWVTASHFSVSCLAPAKGDTFLAKGRVVKGGRKQILATAELFANSENRTKLVATGQTLLVPIEKAPQVRD